MIISMVYSGSSLLASNPRRPKIDISNYKHIIPPPDIEEQKISSNEKPSYREDLPRQIYIDNPNVRVKKSGRGTAFAIDNKGHWVTARHVVDECDDIFLVLQKKELPKRLRTYTIKVDGLQDAQAVKAKLVAKDTHNDMAILSTRVRPKQHLAVVDTNYKNSNDYKKSYSFGFPSGSPGELFSNFIGITKARIPFSNTIAYQEVLLWSIVNKNPNNVSLNGISGGPTLNNKGKVLGVNTATLPRRGRFLTSTPDTLNMFIKSHKINYSSVNEKKNVSLDKDNYINNANLLRKDNIVAQIICHKT